MASTAFRTVSVDLDSRQSDALDDIARLTKRDRQAAISDAIDSDVALPNDQVARSREGLRQARAGEFASNDAARVFRRDR